VNSFGRNDGLSVWGRTGKDKDNGNGNGKDNDFTNLQGYFPV
jgi:hypothetical protein